MNKRIQKKAQKNELTHAPAAKAAEPSVNQVLGRLEQDLSDLAQAFVRSGREMSDAAVTELLGKLQRGEHSAEQALEKIPGIGAKLAQTLHALAEHAHLEGFKPTASAAASKSA